MSMSVSTNCHMEPDPATTVSALEPHRSITIEIKDGDNINTGVTLFFADLAHAERWARDVLGQVEVLKAESANDQPTPEPPLIGAAARDYGRYLNEGGSADWDTWWARYSDNYVIGMEYTGGAA